MNTYQQIIDALAAACGICASDTCTQIMGIHMNQIDLSLLTGAVGVFGAIVGAIVGALIAWNLNRKHDEQKQKRDVLRRFVANRYFLTENFVGKSINEPYIALNEAFVVFADSPPVISALKKFRQELKQNQIGHILTLIKAMAIASKVSIDKLDDDFISHPFTPNPQKCTSDKE